MTVALVAALVGLYLLCGVLFAEVLRYENGGKPVLKYPQIIVVLWPPLIGGALLWYGIDIAGVHLRRFLRKLQ